MGPIIGIDLGTTNSVAAYMKDGRPVVIPNIEGQSLTPSVVAFARDDCAWVGHIAKAQASANPLRTVFSVKRHMGRACSDRDDSATVVSSIKRRMGSDFALTIDGRRYGPVEISAMILQKIKMDCQRILGQAVDRAVVTVPAYFNDNQRRATKEAASMAGLDVVRLVNEPTAAALAYGLDIEGAHTILVWDLGGGTFDVSILELGDGVFEVKAVNGDTQLGGDDYDQRLVEMLIERFADQRHVDFGDDPAARQLLRQLAEDAKMRLSDDTQTQVVLAGQFGPAGRVRRDDHAGRLRIGDSRHYREDGRPRQAGVSDAGVDAMDLDRVVLVGGMTRMPAARRLAMEITGLEPYAHIDPDQVVALGAAIQAGVLAGQVRNVTLVDVTPLSLGIETQGGLFTRLIDRNTAVPTTQSRLFTNARDDQESMEVHVLQGERELAADNMSLGTFELAGITPQPRGEAKVEVVFDIDANGMLHVSATDLQTDASRRIRVESAGAPSSDAVEQMLADSRERMESDRRRREDIQAAIRAENMLRAAQQMTDEAGVAAQGDDVRQAIQTVETAASAVKDALAGGQADEIVAATNNLEASLKTLSTCMKTGLSRSTGASARV